jgi:hypothetical protein
VEEFRRYHIPEATLKRKADELRELRQGNMPVEEYTYQFIEMARYAPEEVDKDSKKQEMLRTMCGSRTGGWSLPRVMSD